MRKSLLLGIAAMALCWGNVSETKASMSYYDVVVDNVYYRISTDSLDEEHPDGYAYVSGLADYSVHDVTVKGYVEYEGLTYHVKSMQGSSFSGANVLRAVTIEEGIEEIGQYVFQNCDSLVSVTLPSTVYSLGKYTFSGCGQLTSVNLPEGITQLRDYTFRNCYSLREITLPQSLTAIGNYVFDSSGLTSITIPSNVASIGTGAFDDCDNLKDFQCDAVTPPTLGSSSFLPQNVVITVPQGSAEAYYSASYWSERIIINGEPLHLTLNVQTPGGLADMILSQTANFRDVNELTVTGSLNDEDFNTIKSRLTGLLSLDLSGTDVTAIPEELLYNNMIIRSVVLPSQLQSIGNYAFYNCYSLENVAFPQTLTYLGSYAFYNCSSITEVEIPGTVYNILDGTFSYCANLQSLKLNEGLAYIGPDAFSNCSVLENVTFPTTLQTIMSYAFAHTSLQSAILNEGLTYLGYAAFYDCANLSKIEMPSTLLQCDDIFNGYDYLTEVVCKAAVPPMVENDWANSVPSGCTLYVPQLLINEYKQAEGWDGFGANIKPIEGYEPEGIYITTNSNVNVLADARPTNTPDLVIYADLGNNNTAGGKMSVENGGVFSVHDFMMQIDRDGYYYADYGNYKESNNTALLTNSQMRADSVMTQMGLYNDLWHFISFPYDVKVSDIAIADDTRWVVRKYAGENRAAGLMDTTWVNLTEDSVMHAYEGYIIMTDRDDDYYPMVVFPAQNNTNKNNIFSTSAVEIALKEYQAEFAHNRSWNLIGNPYPCFYDTRRMQFNAPFTVWNGYGYTAYTTTDDAYILQPFEAFFVQRPVDSGSITFAAEGRQLTSVAAENLLMAYANGQVKRSVINLTLGNEEYTDKARVVINGEAVRAYEMTRDASKFMSSNTAVPQLYSIEADGNYAINERPMGDGKVSLGAYFGKAGSYTLALANVSGENVTLIDLYENKKCNLNAGEYTFTAEQGTCNDRFVLDLATTPTGINGVTTGGDGTGVSVSDGVITVGNADGAAVEVYTIGGSLVGKTNAANAEFNVDGGVYIVKVGGKSHKVVVND